MKFKKIMVSLFALMMFMSISITAFAVTVEADYMPLLSPVISEDGYIFWNAIKGTHDYKIDVREAATNKSVCGFGTTDHLSTDVVRNLDWKKNFQNGKTYSIRVEARGEAVPGQETPIIKGATIYFTFSYDRFKMQYDYRQ